MNIEKLAEKLKPWMQVDTWHTSHPLDDKRFHKSLQSAFSEFGSSIAHEDFKEAMEYLVETGVASKLEVGYLENCIDDSASKAEHIASYLSDTKI